MYSNQPKLNVQQNNEKNWGHPPQHEVQQNNEKLGASTTADVQQNNEKTGGIHHSMMCIHIYNKNL